MTSHEAQQAPIPAALRMNLFSDGQEVLVNETNYVESISHDSGPGRVLASDVAVGLRQVHDDKSHVVFARQPPQIAIQAGFRATKAHVEDLVTTQIDEGLRKTAFTGEEVFIDAKKARAEPVGHL